MHIAPQTHHLDIIFVLLLNLDLSLVQEVNKGDSNNHNHC